MKQYSLEDAARLADAVPIEDLLEEMGSSFPDMYLYLLNEGVIKWPEWLDQLDWIEMDL